MKEEQVYFLIDLCNKFDCLAAFKARSDNDYSQFGKMFSPIDKYIEIDSYGPISIDRELEAIMIDPVVKIEYGKYVKPKLTDNTGNITGDLNAAQITYTQTGKFILVPIG